MCCAFMINIPSETCLRIAIIYPPSFGSEKPSIFICSPDK